PVRHDRGADPGHAAERPTHQRPDDRAGNDVHRRRTGHGHARGAAVMTAPHDQVPLPETSPNGRRPAGPRPKVPGPRPKVPGPEHEDLTESAAHLADGAE